MNKIERRNHISELYEDSCFDEVRTLMHCEALNVRSQKYDWKIEPHRHINIYQLFVVTEGGVEATLDDKPHILKAPFVICIPDGVIHSFDWVVGSSGFVISVTSSTLKHVAQRIGVLDVSSTSDIFSLQQSDVENLKLLCESLLFEESQSAIFKEAMLFSLLQQLLIFIFRLSPKNVPQRLVLSKSEMKLQEFKKLLKVHFSEHHKVIWYARQIGVSTAHLNQICKDHMNITALGLIHKFLLNEAKRLLIFSDIRVTAMADRLGFNEQTYFTKFYKKQTGNTPSEYRRHFR